MSVLDMKRRFFDKKFVGRTIYSILASSSDKHYCLTTGYGYWLFAGFPSCNFRDSPGWCVRKMGRGRFLLFNEKVNNYEVYILLKLAKDISYYNKKLIEIYTEVGVVKDTKGIYRYVSSIGGSFAQVSRLLYLIYFKQSFFFLFKLGDQWYYLEIRVYRGIDYFDTSNIKKIVEGFFLVDKWNGTVYDYVYQIKHRPKRFSAETEKETIKGELGKPVLLGTVLKSMRNIISRKRHEVV